MELILFIITALVALTGAIAMLVSRNAVHSALFLLLNFGAIAVLFLLLQAPFLFAIQLSIYAGAIMVLFLFVVMMLGAERAEDETDKVAWQKPLAFWLGLILFVEALVVSARSGLARAGSSSAPQATFGVPEQIGQTLFTRYILPIELTGIILLVAIVGVVVLSRARKGEEA